MWKCVILILLGFAAGWLFVIQHAALDNSARRISLLEERLATLEARTTLTEVRLDACTVTMREWDTWLEIRANHWGTAWFIQSARAN